MKKTFYIIASVLLTAVTTSAQLKVDSTGKVSIDRTVETILDKGFSVELGRTLDIDK